MRVETHTKRSEGKDSEERRKIWTSGEIVIDKDN
jgi:hypothetical protein